MVFLGTGIADCERWARVWMKAGLTHLGFNENIRRQCVQTSHRAPSVTVQASILLKILTLR